MSNRQCPKCGEEYSDTYRICPFCEEDEAIRKGKPLHRQGGKRLEKRRASSSGGAGGVMLLLTAVIILGVVSRSLASRRKTRSPRRGMTRLPLRIPPGTRRRGRRRLRTSLLAR